jgi:hypothetical protein
VIENKYLPRVEKYAYMVENQCAIAEIKIREIYALKDSEKRRLKKQPSRCKQGPGWEQTASEILILGAFYLFMLTMELPIHFLPLIHGRGSF